MAPWVLKGVSPLHGMFYNDVHLSGAQVRGLRNYYSDCFSLSSVHRPLGLFSSALVSGNADNHPTCYELPTSSSTSRPPSQYPGYHPFTASPYLAISYPSNDLVPNLGFETHFPTLPPLSGPHLSPNSPYSVTWNQRSSPQQPRLIQEFGSGSAEEASLMVSNRHNPSSSSSRRPFRISGDTFFQNPLLYALTEQLLKEPWYLDGAPERRISQEEARSQVGPVGRSIFLAYARRVRSNGAQALWVCLICQASNSAADQIAIGYSREDRILKHIRHHFDHRPWVCSGQCGTTGW